MSNDKGQALIELALSLLLLLLILFGITEFGRYFYFANTFNNAARAGVRQAVVTTPLTATSGNCSVTTGIVGYTCSTIPGANSSITVTVSFDDLDGISGITNGDRVRVRVSSTFTTVAASLIPILSGKSIVGDASMRYEL